MRQRRHLGALGKALAVAVDAFLEIVEPEVALETQSEPMPRSPATMWDSLLEAATTNSGGCGFCTGLGMISTGRDLPDGPVVFEHIVGEGLGDDLDGIGPLLAGVGGIDAEGFERVQVVGAGRGQFGATIRDDIKRGEPFGNQDGMVPGKQHRAHDAQLDVLGVLGDCGIQHLGRRNGKARRAEMLFGRAPGREPEFVGKGNLLDHLHIALAHIDAFHQLRFLKKSHLHCLSPDSVFRHSCNWNDRNSFFRLASSIRSAT